MALVPAALLMASLQPTGAAGAADWYWRPDRPTAYGTGDGTSYANAWRRATDIRWTAMQPGDVLYYCGTHDGGGADRQIITGAPGITISGACPGDPGTLWSTGEKLSAWRGPNAAGVYSLPYGGSTSRALDARRKPLTRLAAPPDAASPCDSWFHAGLFHYKPCGAPLAVYPAGPAPAVLVRHSDVTVEDLTVLNAGRLLEVRDADRVTLRRLHLYYGDSQGIQITGATRDGKIHDNHIHHVGNGIYGITGGQTEHDGWIIERNDIHDVAGGPGGDAHCIGWQNGSNNRIRNNRLVNCAGPALAIYWTGGERRLRNNLWSDNVIDSPANTAISISGHNCPAIPGNAAGNVARGNRITGGPLAFYVKVPPQSLSLFDNVAVGAAVGLRWKFISGGNAAGAPPPFIESGNRWEVRRPYQPPGPTRACPPAGSKATPPR